MKTLRLLMPQWQGGEDESAFPGQIYPLGARLLAWLAPESNAPLVEVPVESCTGAVPEKDGGVFWRRDILRQIRSATNLINAHNPDRIITFGGDCLISQAPFAYLNERYEGDIGLLWLDAHPDVTTPREFDHAHAMVLGNLLGEGEPSMAGEVKRHYLPEQILLAGVDEVLPHEQATIDRLSLRRISSKEILSDSGAITQWIRQSRYGHIAIHWDLDVLHPEWFSSLLLRNPDVDTPIETEAGKLSLQAVARILQDISAHTTVVGISFAEYMPWDALNLKHLLAGLPFMR